MAAALPRSLGELQLYRILQKANLLCYYEAFIQQGGDDVQQLCEAAEDEFLEIMALVGMASKPLHVRRLQKALRDWVTNPALFNQPLGSLPVCSIPVYKLPEGSPTLPRSPCPPHDKVPKCVVAECLDLVNSEVDRTNGQPGGGTPQSGGDLRFWAGHGADSEQSLSPAELNSPASPHEGLDALDAGAVQSVAECIDRMARALPRGEAADPHEQLRGNKKLARMIGHIFDMSVEDPRREEEVRKYSTIYGRFDSKRRDGKHLTLHELTVNEAAAQLCMRDTALLTRRDELFALARQISREVTYKSQFGDRDELSPKKIKTEEGFLDLQSAVRAIRMRQETLREQLEHAKSKGEESLGQSLQDAAAKNRLQPLDWRIPPEAFKHGANWQRCGRVFTFKTSDQQESPLNLQMAGPRHRLADGDIPLGKQLANELKRRHSISERATPTTEKPKAENGNATNHSRSTLNFSNRTLIKSEPEDSR
ncbi:hypothetical protein JZ751_018438 [Albula glossodonta]|uniref:NGFI-A-binding protein 1 n=1 Tax=Albula glossodonta TaxID=121402 RepID=A0A8T2MLA9_9TELE|nr:hypothetical protein JZ751_018438 [Albula glossodonta]